MVANRDTIQADFIVGEYRTILITDPNEHVADPKLPGIESSNQKITNPERVTSDPTVSSSNESERQICLCRWIGIASRICLSILGWSLKYSGMQLKMWPFCSDLTFLMGTQYGSWLPLRWAQWYWDASSRWSWIRHENASSVSSLRGIHRFPHK